MANDPFRLRKDHCRLKEQPTRYVKGPRRKDRLTPLRLLFEPRKHFRIQIGVTGDCDKYLLRILCQSDVRQFCHSGDPPGWTPAPEQEVTTTATLTVFRGWKYTEPKTKTGVDSNINSTCVQSLYLLSSYYRERTHIDFQINNSKLAKTKLLLITPVVAIILPRKLKKLSLPFSDF